MKIENPQEYIGKKYGHTTILKYIGRYRDNTYAYNCRCDCGREFIIRMREKSKVRHCCASCQAKLSIANKKRMIYEYCGEKICLKDLANKLNINRYILASRIYTYKWDIDRWAEPVKKRRII